MRIRSTKPEFWRSERIASVSWDARLVLKGLESFVDDNGVGKDDLALIVGDLFQRDLVREPSRTLARVSEAISALNDAGLIHRYDAAGTKLLFVSFWESVQRVDKPQPGRFPRPDGTSNYKDSLIREASRGVPEPSRALAPGTGEQGNRGTGEQTTPKGVVPRKRGTRIPEDFEVTPDMVQWARENTPLVDGKRATEKFTNHFTAMSGRNATKVDWVRTWRNWMLTDQERAERQPQARKPKDQQVIDILEQGRQMQAMEDRRAIG